MQPSASLVSAHAVNGSVTQLPMQSSLHHYERCTLLAGSFDYLVQLSLVFAALGTLLYKRRIEKHKRPWVVWAFDTSKQAYAGVLQHLVNMVLGMAFASDNGAGGSECAWYLVNFVITTFVGIALLIGAPPLALATALDSPGCCISSRGA